MSRTVVILLTCGLAAGGSTLSAFAQDTSVTSPSVLLETPRLVDQPAKPARPASPTPPAQPAPPVPPPVPPAPPAAVAPPVPPAPPAPPAPPRRMVNIQLEFTITDQIGSATAEKKTVSMIAADGSWGRVRASASTRNPLGGGLIPVSLNVDARPLTVGNDSIQIELTVEYRPVTPANPGEAVRTDSTNLNQSLSVFLQNGKPMVVSQAADPVTDRKIVVEAKATVLK